MAKDQQATKQVPVPAEVSVKQLAEKLDIGVGALISQLMQSGVMATINDVIDFETAEIVADDLGFSITLDETGPAAPAAASTTELKPGEGVPRPPVVAAMGHVDHGKTTLLDAIRTTGVADQEAGGITQHIGAYQVAHGERLITFLDTPGHEAFSVLRAHGARLTDVAIIVVAADDGIKPQTIEAIEYAKEAGVRIVAAINKIDVTGADPNRCRQQLSEHGLQPEEWGGDTPVIEISAKEGKNIDKLLDLVLLVADVEDLRARGEGPAEGIIIESHLATGLGPVTTLLVEHGQLKRGSFLAAGAAYGKVRSLRNDGGNDIDAAGPSTPAVVSGWKVMPHFGERFQAFNSEKAARQQAASVKRSQSQAVVAGTKKTTEQEDILSAIAAGKTTIVPLVVKADVQGSLESLLQSLESLSNDEVAAKVVGQGIGDINESDIAQAESAGARAIGFNVAIGDDVQRLAARSGVETATYKVIYELLDDVKGWLESELAPETIEEVKGLLEVKGIFRVTKTSLICGGLLKEGTLTPGLKVRHLPKGGEAIEIGTLRGLKREQDAVKEIAAGSMCGLSIDTEAKADVAEGDKLEFFTIATKKRSL